MAPKKKVKPSEPNPDKIMFAEKSSWMSENIKANAVNSKIISEMLMPALMYVKNLELFNDWDAPQPLQLKTQDDKSSHQLGAFMAPFDKKSCMQSLQNSGKYICAVPLPHFNLQYSPTPGVRLSKGQMDEAVADDDFTYKVWPMQKVAVCSDEHNFTNLTLISPEEPRIANIVNFVRRHELGQVTADQEAEYKRLIWCIPTCFYICDSIERRFFDAIAERRDAIKNCRMVRRSGSQQVEEIVSTANRLGGGKCTAQRIFEAYKQNMRGIVSCAQDESLVVSFDMIQMALSVQKAIKDVPALASILQEADNLLMTNSPFFNITNLAALVKKIKNPADLQWTMALMLDCIVQQPDLTWTIRTLAPKGGEVGIIDQCVFKHHLKTEFLSKVMEDIDLDPAEKKLIRDCLSSVVTMRQSLGYKTGIKMNTEPYKLAQFLTGVSKAGERVFKIINDWVYTADHDEAIAGHLGQKRNAKDMVKLPLIADAIKEIAEQLEQQQEAAQDNGDEEEEGDDDNADGSVANPSGAGSNPSAKKKVVPPKPPRNEDGQFLGYKEDGSEIRSKGKTAEAIKIVNAELRDAAFIVERACQFLVVDNSCSEDSLADMLRESKALGPCPDKRTAILYETGSSGQASCNPKVNCCPFRKEHFDKCMRGFLNSRCSESNSKATDISGKDTYYIWDNKKARNHTQMMSSFSHNKVRMNMAEPKELLCVWDSSTVQDRMSRTKRGFACRHTKEHENILVVSREVFGSDIEYKERKHHTGNNLSSVIGFITHLPANSQEEFRATPEQKAQIFSAENTIPMSGSNYIAASEDPGHASESGKGEPVFFWGSTEKFADEMIHCYGWERLCSCTSGNGSYAVAGCINRIPGVYFCMTEAHRTMLKQHVINRIFQLKQTRECSNLYNPALVTAITGEEVPGGPKSKKKNDGSQAGKNGDEPPGTPAGKKAEKSDPVSGAKTKKPTTGRSGQPPKKKKKGADGTAIKSDEDDNSGMWSSETE